jgi:hypothetical protein
MKYYPAAFFFYFLLASCYNSSLKENSEPSSSKPSTQTELIICDYNKCKTRSNTFYNEYISKHDSITKEMLINNIRDSLFVCWYGTEWDFYGTTEEPGKGKIACGYFVTTILRDIGVPVKRFKHAQMASEEMINDICLKNNISRYANKDIPTFVEKMKTKGAGLYIVGLDFHTGFILNDGKEIYFVHSNYVAKKGVMSEIASASSVLAASKRQVIGRII